MTQTAYVKSLLPDGRAEVGVKRKSACSHDCSKCSGCELTITYSELTMTVENPLGAHTGDTVLIESSNSSILGAAVVVYLVPFLLFFIGYFLVQAFSLGEGYSICAAFIGLIIGLLSARQLDRRVKKKKNLRFCIVEILQSCSDI